MYLKVFSELSCAVIIRKSSNFTSISPTINLGKIKMSDNSEGEILMLEGYPFYMKQPTDKMNKLFEKYESVLQQSLGKDCVGVYSMGSGAIPGMVGPPMIDILLAMKNEPPTEDQLAKLKELNIGLIGDGKSPHNPKDTWFQNLDFPNQENFEEFKIDGAHPPDGHLGRLILHFVHYQNPWVGQVLCYVEFLKQNQEAFEKYRDVKVEGARMQSTGGKKDDDTSGMSPFRKYKMHKAAVVAELMEAADKWRAEGNFQLPQILLD